jgi:hypothetical protein
MESNSDRVFRGGYYTGLPGYLSIGGHFTSHTGQGADEIGFRVAMLVPINPVCHDGFDNEGDGLLDFDGGASLDLDHDGFIDAQFNPAMPPVGAPDPQCLRTPWDSELEPECIDGTDNDGDGFVDLDDPGCANSSDIDEHTPALPCDDGVDDDGDGLADYRADGVRDPACVSTRSVSENPQCQDGLDNDGDALIDFDGGASLDLDPHDGFIDAQFNPAMLAVGAADPQCVGRPWKGSELPGPCGLGFELVFLAPLLSRLARRRA